MKNSKLLSWQPQSSISSNKFLTDTVEFQKTLFFYLIYFIYYYFYVTSNNFVFQILKFCNKQNEAKYSDLVFKCKLLFQLTPEMCSAIKLQRVCLYLQLFPVFNKLRTNFLYLSGHKLYNP